MRLWRVPVVVGCVLVLACAATLEPLAPTVLAPGSMVGVAPLVPAPEPANVVDALVPPTPAPAPAAPQALPTMAPIPTVEAVLSASAQNMLASIRGDLSARWLKNHTETALRSGPNEQSQQFTMLPQFSTLRLLESRADWFLVQYGGDGATRQAGPGWVKASDVGGIDPPSVWLSSTRTTALWGNSDATASRALDVPPSALMEVIGPEFLRDNRVHVRLPGDGRQLPPAQGWVDAESLTRTRTPGLTQVPRAYPAILAADVRLKVPYRTQLDGSDYAGANCGPTTLGMALEAFGVNIAPRVLRGEVLVTENFASDDVDAGSFIWALERVASASGLRTYGLYDANGGYHRWSIDDVRASVRASRPVIAQVVYRGLPGREESGYDGDHYVVITGLMGDNFIYNDPIGGAEAREAPGWDRVMTSAELQRAMRASDRPYAYTAFGLSSN